MNLKVFSKQLGVLMSSLTKIKNEIKETREQIINSEDELDRAKKDFDIEMAALNAIQSQQEKKLSVLETKEMNLELKSKSMDEEIFQWDCYRREGKDELEQLNSENAREKKKNVNALHSLRKNIEKAKLELEAEESNSVEVEKHYEKLRVSRAADLEEKLKKIRKSNEDRLKVAESKYKAKKEPLIERIKTLDYEIDENEKEILRKPKELMALKKKNNFLEKKLLRVTMKSLMEESELTIEAINKALSYFLIHPKTSFDDVKLSVLMTKSNLKWISDRLESRFGYHHVMKMKLTETMKTCETILEMNQTQNSLLLNKQLWEKGAEGIVYGKLRVADEFLLPDLNDCQGIADYVMKGTPNHSDSCINELIMSDCNVSGYCWFSETYGDFHFGYKTSHRLIYLQAASKLQCDKKNKKYFDGLQERKMNLCRRMLSEARNIFGRTRFLTLKDLFLENIALCGLEGYGEFGPEKWRREVRGWQNDRGCFGQHATCSDCLECDLKGTVKRTDSVVDDCHTHVTAVALAAMAFHLRIILNSLLFLPTISAVSLDDL